jgi:acetylglutamate kinase
MLDLFRAAPHVRMHLGQTMVIKVGGVCLAKPSLMRGVVKQVAAVQALGAQVVLVHGGGPQTDVVQRMLGEEPQMIDGRRVTTPKALQALRMATAGELHSDIVAALAREGAPAVGVSAASAGVLVAKKRPPVTTSSGVVDFGAVGDVQSVDPAPLRALLDAGQMPVLCPPASDGAGGVLNVNADVTAAALAAGLGASKLVFLTGAAGVLRDPADANSLFSSLSLAELAELGEEGALAKGMLVKATAIATALESGVDRAHVVSGLDPEALLVELYTTSGAGTLITTEKEELTTAVSEGAFA